MKKNFIQFTLFLAFSFLIISCSTSDNDDDDFTPISQPDPQPAQITYTTVASIMTNNCTSCHGTTPTNGAPISLTTYDQVRQAIESRNLIGRIENGTMPPNGSLSSTEINNIKSWQAQGFPQ